MKKLPPYITEVLAALLILLFVYTALSKLINVNTFENALSESPVLDKYAHSIAVILPLTELITSVLLFIPAHREKGFVLSFFLLFSFTFYIACMLLFALPLPCSCGGVLQSLTWPQHLIFNCFFTFLSALGWLIESKNKINSFKTFIAIKQVGSRKS